MRHALALLLVLTLPAVCMAQRGNSGSGRPSGRPGAGSPPSVSQPIQRPPYTTAPAPAPVAYGAAYPVEYGASTAAGSALNGMSQVISSAGQYNLATSQAAVNMTEAQRNAMQNRVQNAQDFWTMREIGRAGRERERGPKPTAEDLARYARDGAPKALNTSQVDPVTGQINWPEALRDNSFDTERAEVDQLIGKQVTKGGLNHDDRAQLREMIDNMFDKLKAQIRDIPPQIYVASRTFLRSLQYASTGTDL